LGGYSLLVAWRIEGPASATHTAVRKFDSDPHHAHWPAVHLGLNVHGAVGVQENGHIDPKSIRIHVEMRNRYDGVVALAEQRIQCQRRGQCPL
jgi:hypothetical protein